MDDRVGVGFFHILPVLVLALVFGAPAYADGGGVEGKVYFNLPSDEFPKAILEFYHQSRIEVLFLASDNLSEIHTQPVVGEFEPVEALERMLKGTGLTFRFATEHSVTIKQPDVADAPRTPSAPEVLRAPSPPRTVTVIADRVESTSEVYVPAGTEMITISRSSIDLASAQTVAEVLSVIPQIWHGGANTDTYLGEEASQNADKAVGTNTRGLDDGATLVLLNGHRLAPSGIAGGWTDVSVIPVSAIDRVQLLPGGLSVSQGGDAIGGTINFLSPRKFEGSETDAAYGHVTSGPMGELRIAQLAGGQWSGGNGFLAVEYYRTGDLQASYRARATSDLTHWGGQNLDSPNCNPGSIVGTSIQQLCDRWHGADLEPAQRHYSALGTASFALGDQTVLSVDALASERDTDVQLQDYTATLLVPATNAWIPQGLKGPLAVDYSFSGVLGQQFGTENVHTGNLASTITTDFGHGWSALGQLGWGIETLTQRQYNWPDFSALAPLLASSDPTLAFDPFQNPSRTSAATIAAIRTQARYDSDSQIRWTTAQLKGPIFRLPGGDTTVTIGGEYRQQVLNSHPQSATETTDFSRDVRSPFLQAHFPVFDKDSIIGQIDVDAGVRNDRYSDVGSTVVPQIGARWAPTPSYSIKGSWARPARPPDLLDLNQSDNHSAILSILDASSGTRRNILVAAGGNPTLRMESAETWNLEVDTTPTSVPGLSAGVAFFDAHFANKAEQALLEATILQDPSLAYTVIRDPSPQLRATICHNSTFVGGLPSTCQSAPIYALVDLREHNVAQTWTDGFDVYGRYLFDRLGHWEIGALGTYVLNYKKRQTPGSPDLQLVNTQTNPISLKTRAYVTWALSRFGLTCAVNHSGSYRDIASIPERSVASWTTEDLRLSYDPFGSLNISLNIKNIGNTESPFLNNLGTNIGYDQENGSLLGRTWTVDVRWRW